MLSKKEYALMYVTKYNWSITPLAYIKSDGSCSCWKGKECSKGGKHPVMYNWSNNPIDTGDKVNRIWTNGEEYPYKDSKGNERELNGNEYYNIGLLTGKINNIIVLDVDISYEVDGNDTLRKMEQQYGELPNTVEAITGSGGRHIFFKYPKGYNIRNSVRFAPGLDIRTNGGQVVIEPSSNENGEYHWDIEHHPEDIEIAEMPIWLLNMLEETEVEFFDRDNRKRNFEKNIIKIGERNSTLFKDGCSFKARGMNKAVIRAALNEENKLMCEVPLSDDELNSIVKSVLSYSSGDNYIGDISKSDKEILKFNLSDVGNAQRFVNKYGDIVRYSHNHKKWFIWDGGVWTIDRNCTIETMAKEVIKDFEKVVEKLEKQFKFNQNTSEKEVKKYRRFVLNSEKDNRIKAMINQVKSEKGIAIDIEMMDSNKYLLNCINGTIDLKTGKLLQHNKEELITKIIPVKYDCTQKCPEFMGFIKRIFQNNIELINFIQKSVGYTLTGETGLQCFYILVGNGANGKSTFLSTIKHILGDYGKSLKGSSLMIKKFNEGARGDLAKLSGSRFVTATELNDGQTFDESLLKAITGGDSLPVRHLYGEEFELDIQFKLWIATNEKPKIKGSDNGIWRRIRMIPFNYSIPEDERDRNFFEKVLLPEASGILNWVVEGCHKYINEGIEIPKCVKLACNEYRSEMDIIQIFINENCINGDEFIIGASQLYQAFNKWQEVNGYHKITSTKFGIKLKEKGFTKKRISAGNIYCGLKLAEHILR